MRGAPATIEPIVSASGAYPGSRFRLALRVELPEGFHVQSNAPRDPNLIATALAVLPADGVTAREVVFPPAQDFKQEGSPEPLAVFERSFLIGVEVEIAKTRAPGEVTIPARLRYQTCDDKVCYRPVTVETAWTVRVVPAGTKVEPQHGEAFKRIAFGKGTPPSKVEDIPAPAAPRPTATRPIGIGDDDPIALLDRFTIRATAGGYMNSAEFLRFVADAEAGIAPRGLFDGRSAIAIVAIVFIGGLALNLTPCVLPMIPINLAIIGAGSQRRDRGRGFLLGATYGGAMAVVYGVLGLVVILTAGTFGTINASPWFNGAIALLFVVLGLAMFDLVTIDFSRFSSGIRFNDASRGTFLLAFGMGAIAALLAGACVAPVVIQVVLFASERYASGSAVALALPFLLGLGMAVPWPVAGAGLAALPKPGAWMVRVKYAFGVFILATAAYYAYLTYEIVANRWVDPATVSASVEEKIKSGWNASLADGLRIADRDRTPVLIDLWATWCKNCLVMDRTTLADPQVEAAIAKFTRIKLQAEDPEVSPARDVMDRAKAVGLPTYVILYPRSAEVAYR